MFQIVYCVTSLVFLSFPNYRLESVLALEAEEKCKSWEVASLYCSIWVVTVILEYLEYMLAYIEGTLPLLTSLIISVCFALHTYKIHIGATNYSATPFMWLHKGQKSGHNKECFIGIQGVESKVYQIYENIHTYIAHAYIQFHKNPLG